MVRWEGSRTTPFLRTVEFLWQEGHCVFSSQEDALENATVMTRHYQAFMTQTCALPVIAVKNHRRTICRSGKNLCLEAMMQDGKAVQAGTSHYLGQNFAKASEIRFQDSDNEYKIPHTTSWGVSTRLIGAIVMTHSDDKGLRLPPRLAKYQIVILPAGKQSTERDEFITGSKPNLKRPIFLAINKSLSLLMIDLI